MEISCSNCHGHFNLPDDKVPAVAQFRLTCPQCKTKITVTNPPREGGGTGGLNDESRATTEVTTEDTEPADEAALDVFEEDRKTALVCDDQPASQQLLKTALEELDYRVTVTTTTQDALNKMRFTHYDVIALQENFAGSTADNNPVLKQLQPLAMGQRRHIFVALIGPGFKSLNNMMAFARSVNVVINSQDLSNIQAIFKKAISDNDRFYKVFKDTLKALGKV